MWQKRSYSAKKGASAKEKEPDASAANALNYMVGLLAKREHSQSELEQKALRHYTQEAVDEALTKCVENDYQSDERYAEMLVRHMQFALYGPNKLRYEAMRKGADLSLVSDQIAEVDWDDLAYEALVKKYSMIELDYAQRNKALAYLTRRGFSPASSIKALERMKRELSEDEYQIHSISLISDIRAKKFVVTVTFLIMN